jgi:hypothetical protein
MLFDNAEVVEHHAFACCRGFVGLEKDLVHWSMNAP